MTTQLLAAKAQATADALDAEAAAERDRPNADELWSDARRHEQRARAMIREIEGP